jgi:hypothetical protein
LARRSFLCAIFCNDAYFLDDIWFVCSGDLHVPVYIVFTGSLEVTCTRTRTSTHTHTQAHTSKHTKGHISKHTKARTSKHGKARTRKHAKARTSKHTLTLTLSKQNTRKNTGHMINPFTKFYNISPNLNYYIFMYQIILISKFGLNNKRFGCLPLRGYVIIWYSVTAYINHHRYIIMILKLLNLHVSMHEVEIWQIILWICSADCVVCVCIQVDELTQLNSRLSIMASVCLNSVDGSNSENVLPPLPHQVHLPTKASTVRYVPNSGWSRYIPALQSLVPFRRNHKWV